MLGDAGDDMIALILVGRRDALDGEIIGLCRSAGEDDFARRRRMNELGDPLPGDIDGGFALPTEGMISARGVAKFFREIRKHLLQHPRVNGSGRVIIHINGRLDIHKKNENKTAAKATSLNIGLNWYGIKLTQTPP